MNQKKRIEIIESYKLKFVIIKITKLIYAHKCCFKNRYSKRKTIGSNNLHIFTHFNSNNDYQIAHSNLHIELQSKKMPLFCQHMKTKKVISHFYLEFAFDMLGK